MQLWQLIKFSGRFLGHYMPILVLSLTAIALPSCMTNQPAKPFSSESLPTETIAEISEIRSYPVRVKYINATSARPATVGAALKVNESVSTEEASTAQVTMRTGAIIRIGGNSNLTLKPQNQVEFASGRLVAWTASDRKTSAQITTPFGEISSNNGTLYIEIPNKAAEDRRIIALDGTVTVLVKSTSETLTLNKGEEIRIKADGKATAPKRIDKESIDKKIANNALIFGFSSQLASLPQITSEFGVTSTVKEASTVQFRRADLPKKPNENNNAPKVNYTSGAANNERNDRRDDPPSTKNSDNKVPDNRNPEPSVPYRSNDPIPSTPTTSPQNPSTPPEVTPQPTPNTPISSPIAPSQPQPQPSPLPLEPPPQPVQPEIPVPISPPSNPAPKR